MPAIDVLRALLERQRQEIERSERGIRTGSDPEELHRFRVAVRRARALIRASRPLVRDQLAALDRELRWLGSATGPLRDLDVLLVRLEKLQPTLDPDGAGVDVIVAALERERLERREAASALLDTTRYRDLLARFAAGPGAAPRRRRCARRAAGAEGARPPARGLLRARQEAERRGAPRAANPDDAGPVRRGARSHDRRPRSATSRPLSVSCSTCSAASGRGGGRGAGQGGRTRRRAACRGANRRARASPAPEGAGGAALGHEEGRAPRERGVPDGLGGLQLARELECRALAHPAADDAEGDVQPLADRAQDHGAGRERAHAVGGIL